MAILPNNSEEKAGMDTLAIDEKVENSNSLEPKSPCVSPASSHGGVYTVNNSQCF